MEQDEVHAKIHIILVGTTGLLDLPEGDWSVRYLEDRAEDVKQGVLKIMRENPEYRKFGWTMVSGHKVLTEAEVNELLSE